MLFAAFCLTVSTATAQRSATLEFSDFFVHPIGPRGLQPTAQLRAAAGHDVTLVGFMVQREQAQPGRFQLAPRPVAMAEEADGDADDLPATTVTVLLPEGQSDRIVSHRVGPVRLTGRLEYGPAEDATGRVTWLRLHLPPQALALMAAPALPASSQGH